MSLDPDLVRSEHIAHLDSEQQLENDLLTVVANCSACNLDSQKVTYDLAAIEATIGHKYFMNKPIISMKAS